MKAVMAAQKSNCGYLCTIRRAENNKGWTEPPIDSLDQA